MEAGTGQVAFSRNAGTRRQIASTTKMMTALVTLDEASLDDVFRATDYRPAPVESQLGLRPGERMSVRDLLRAALLPSANDAAVALAVGVSGSRPAFVREMNRTAKRIGLTDTHYANPIGLDAPGNYSTATDLAKLAVVLRRNAFARETMDSPRVTLRTGSHVRTVVNRNNLVRSVPFVNGVKTGHTNVAGNLLVGSASRDGVTVISVVMGEPGEAQRDADSLALLRFGLSSFRRATLLRKGRVMARPKLAHRDAHVEVVAASEVLRTIRRSDRSTVVAQGVPAELDGPVAAGTRVGTAVVRLNGRVVQRVPLVTATAVTAASLGDKARDLAGGAGVLWVLPVLLVGTLLAMGLRRRALRRRRAVRRRERRAA